MNCKQLRTIRFFGISLLILAPTSATRAGLLVSHWSLQNLASVTIGTNVTSDSSIINSNSPAPFLGTRFNSVGDSNASVAYAMAWSGDSGSFRIDGAHTAIHPTANAISSISAGSIDFVPSVDSLVTMHVRYDYSLPGIFMQALGSGGLSDNQTDQPYIDLYENVFSFGPTSGSYDQTMSAVVPAGCHCGFGYALRLDIGATETAATDSGFVEMTIAPLPEPTMLIPSLFGMMIVNRRRFRT